MHRSELSPGRLRILALVLAIASPQSAPAQRVQPDPHLAYAFPAGCQQGTSIEITLGGQFIKDANEAYVAGAGVEVEIVKWYRALTSGEYNNLRMALNDAREKLMEERKASGTEGEPSYNEVAKAAGITPEQLHEMQIYRERDRDGKRQPNEQLEEQVTLKLTVADNAEPGKRELRLLTDTSMSNPLWLHIGKWPELREIEPNDRHPDSGIDQLPIVVNGQVMPGDVDRFAFAAKKGMRLVIEASARDVIPYLADAVPGWFQAVMALEDSAGNELAYSDSFHFRQDPVIYFEVPRDDKYTIAIHDSIYRGREDFVYRLTLGELPYVTGVFPLGARLNSEVTVELLGWNLSQSTLDVRTQSRRQLPVRWYSVPQQDGLTVHFPLQIDNLPETLDREPNNDPTSAQEITTRSIVNGRIDQPGDQDVFRIQGPGRVVADVHARRHGSPLDSMVTLTDAQGKELAFNDDYEDKSQSFLTHHADSHLSVVLPKSATYYLHLTDAQQNGGKEFSYRLYVRAPQPDYELRVVPSTIVARAGAVVPITVFAMRRDGFAEDIELTLGEQIPGLRLDGAVIPGKADKVRMTLTMPAAVPDRPVALEMEGHARRDRKSTVILTKPAVPAENMMQAFIWYHLVPVEQWTVIVSGKPGPQAPFQIVMPAPRVKLPRSGPSILTVKPLHRNIPADQLRLELSEPPKGVSAKMITNEAGAFAIEVKTDEKLAEPESIGNLIFHAFQEWTPAPTESDTAPKARRTDFGFLPAVPYEIAEQKPGQKKTE